MNTQILFRYHRDHDEEFKALEKSELNYVKNRILCKDSLVIGRYSVLPYYKELEEDLSANGCKLINSYEQHNYIANFDYYYDVMEYTFSTWTDLSRAPEGAFVVKGRTNSRKHRWNQECFAENKRRAAEIAHNLKDDQLIGPQGIIYRRYLPLRKLDEGLYGLPFSEEYRFFYLRSKLIAAGFYWSQIDNPPLVVPSVYIDFANEVAEIISKNVNAFVLDIARLECGGLILIEVNDFQMSGLSLIDSNLFYSNLYLGLESFCI
jgi:ATP-grasp domain, R2K clade family 3